MARYPPRAAARGPQPTPLEGSGIELPGMDILVRPEAPCDEAGIRRVNELAFGRAGEAGLVDALRGTAAWVPGLSLVTEQGAEITGHVLFSEVALDTGPA